MENTWEEEWRRHVLTACMAEIRSEVTPRSYQAFHLFAEKGWPASKVAQELEMTPNAVFQIKKRILDRLRELIPTMEEAW